jgi:hypothetical protein
MTAKNEVTAETRKNALLCSLILDSKSLPISKLFGNQRERSSGMVYVRQMEWKWNDFTDGKRIRESMGAWTIGIPNRRLQAPAVIARRGSAGFSARRRRPRSGSPD